MPDYLRVFTHKISVAGKTCKCACEKLTLGDLSKRSDGEKFRPPRFFYT
jgi:hypothetical protein